MAFERVVITGTRNGRADIAALLDRFVAEDGWPGLWILGDARGVDTQALEWLRVHGLTNFLIVHVDKATPSPQRFHDRNQRMVDMATGVGGAVCLAFPDRSSRGTYDCLRRAKAAGLEHRLYKDDSRAAKGE